MLAGGDLQLCISGGKCGLESDKLLFGRGQFHRGGIERVGAGRERAKAEDALRQEPPRISFGE